MKKDSGLIKQIVLVIIALILLKYAFNFDVIAWIKSDQGQKVISPIISIIKSVYSWLDSFVRSLVSK